MKNGKGFTEEELFDTIDGIMGLMVAIPSSSDKLGLSNEQVGVFCRNTPNGKKGEELWMEYASRRDADSAPEGYDFSNFMAEVLANAGCPL